MVKILYESKSVLAFYKPSGIEVLDFAKSIKVKPGLVHRLDKDTTGVILAAKNKSAYDNLKKQFQDREVKKEYLAVLEGNMKHDTGVIDSPIARSKTDFRKRSPAPHGVQGKEALTRYRVDKRFIIKGEKFSLVTFFPKTGRTHQIRVHAKSIGHPISGDVLYGIKKRKYRQLLHAKSIKFVDPGTGEEVKVEASIPRDFVLK